MPRKQKRGPDGKKTPWFSQKAEAAHERAVTRVRSRCGLRQGAGSSDYPIDLLVREYFTIPGYTLRVVPSAENGGWVKCAFKDADGDRVYLLTSYPPHQEFSAGLVALCEKIEEMWAGDLKPSPDTWQG